MTDGEKERVKREHLDSFDATAASLPFSGLIGGSGQNRCGGLNQVIV